MFAPREHETFLLHLIRVTARATSIVCLAIIFFFFLTEEFNPDTVPARDWIGVVFFPVSVLIGLVLAWRREALGGAISVLGVMCFYVIYGWLLAGSMRQGWAFLPFLIPGSLFLIYGYLATPGARRIIERYPA